MSSRSMAHPVRNQLVWYVTPRQKNSVPSPLTKHPGSKPSLRSNSRNSASHKAARFATRTCTPSTADRSWKLQHSKERQFEGSCLRASGVAQHRPTCSSRTLGKCLATKHALLGQQRSAAGLQDRGCRRTRGIAQTKARNCHASMQTQTGSPYNNALYLNLVMFPMLYQLPRSHLTVSTQLPHNCHG